MIPIIEVYFYIPSADAENAVECGLKLSRWFNKEITFEGNVKKYMSTLLNPRDDMVKYKSKDLKCLKLAMPPHYCFAADQYLYGLGRENPGIMELYLKSIVPAQEYIFGTYRLPECLVASTAIPGQVSILEKLLETPILFSNSEELYLNNLMESFKEEREDIHDCLLYYFYLKLEENHKVIKIEDMETRLAVFINKENGKRVTLKIPDISQY